MQSHFASIVMLLITMVIWGSTFVVTKGINDQVQPFTLAFVRVAIGAVVLLGCAFVRQARGGTHARWSTLPWGTMITMALIGLDGSLNTTTRLAPAVDGTTFPVPASGILTS